jgi:glycosyltransferase involved in cell wall biosynthesis
MMREMGAQDREPKRLISVIVPAFNEASELAGNLEALIGTLLDERQPHDYEVIVVDDGSGDGTYETAQSVARRYANVQVLRHEFNRGLGCAMRTGFAAAKGSIIAVFDSDLSYSPEIVPQLVAELERRNADVALASAYMRGGSVRNVPWTRRVLSREANRFLSYATNGRYATITCMVRAYDADFVRAIETTEERMEINVELLFKAIKRGAVIVEIPAALQWSSKRCDAPSRLKAGATLKQIWRTLRYGVSHRPAVLLALPGILPGVLPLIIAVCALAHLNLKTIATIVLVTMIIQNASLALFAGQLASFFRNLTVRARGAPDVTR